MRGSHRQGDCYHTNPAGEINIIDSVAFPPSDYLAGSCAGAWLIMSPTALRVLAKPKTNFKEVAYI